MSDFSLRRTIGRLAAACTLLFLLGIPVRGLAFGGLSLKKATPVIVDTDMAFDDWLAVYLLLKTQDVQLISIAGTGETYCDAGVSNAQYLLRLAQKPDIPVACGRTEPLNGYHAFPTAWRVESSEMRARDVFWPVRQKNAASAVDLMAKTLARSAGGVKVVALGPLTNIAELIQTKSEFTQKITELFIMGGAVDVPGNIRVPGFSDYSRNEKSEWNFYIDPAATAIVMRHSIPKFIVPLDATRFAPVDLSFIKKLKAIDDLSAKFFFRSYMAMKPQIDAGHLYFWDVAAAACAIAEGACTFKREKFLVNEAVANPGCTAKRVRCEYVEKTAGALIKDPKGHEANYAVMLSKEAVQASVLKTLERQ